ncbi:GNAT family N-acetyltransferase [Sphingomonas desiccabilis]|uniref:N-acetyltransferase n=1 Tax=Sphingomonas desiccabilis TaxID=429134 RepID=A0A4Q2IYB4_9SPHN|nr:GNAT family N-acetyltransferase [Sphingomonas desiccabilis]MBB3909434.1 RimJ/RimL family protein N-acetyltransferase [Sphingomonas desiccabilis]RXZ34181.1 N-acetyltransferase [Sphingomonas desiccabilis]
MEGTQARGEPVIETERLLLARPTLADFEDSCAMLSDASVMAFIGGKPLGREDAWNKLLRNIGHWAAFGHGIFTVRAKDGGRFLGEVGIGHFARGFGASFDPFPEAAWILVSAAHGRGYATEAVQAAHAWMAEVHKAKRTVCLIHPDNLPSVRVAEKLGYRRFGEVRYRDAPGILFERGAQVGAGVTP